MRLYIFSSVDSKYKLPFRLFVVQQNLKVTRVCALLLMIVCTLASFISFLAPKSYVSVPYEIELRCVILLLLAISTAYYFILKYIRKLSTRNRVRIKNYLGISYSVLIILCTMWLSLVSGKSPANNMTMFMFGLFFVSVTWLYSLKDVIYISAITFISLTVGLVYYLPETSNIFINLVAGAIFILGFYFVSRMLYSYHANYYIQLKQIEYNNQEITKIAHLKTEMLGIVAHDLRSPINSVTALVDLSKTATSKEEREEYSNMILEACNDARNIIKDLILTVKGESDQGLQLKDVNLNLFLSEIQQSWTHQLRDNKKMLLNLPEDIINAAIDRDKILRVFDNLITNAIKFTEHSATIHLKLSTLDKDKIKITIADDGIGIPEDMLPYLFDRFSKAGRLGLNGEKSHGLGLNICKQIVTQHNGKISVDSIVGKGTQFHITLPISA